MNDSFELVLENIVVKWKENIEIEMETISFGRSFMKHDEKKTHISSIFSSKLCTIDSSLIRNYLKWALTI